MSMLLPSLSLGRTWKGPEQAAAIRLLAQVAAAASPTQALKVMSAAMQSDYWLVREAAVKACGTVLTQFRRHPEMDSAALFTHLCAALQDPAACVRTTALEGMAMLCLSMGASEFLQMLNDCDMVKDSTKQLVRQRLEDPTPPSMNALSQALELPRFALIDGSRQGERPHAELRSSAPSHPAATISAAMAGAQPADPFQRNGDRRLPEVGFGAAAPAPASQQVQSSGKAWPSANSPASDGPMATAFSQPGELLGGKAWGSAERAETRSISCGLPAVGSISLPDPDTLSTPKYQPAPRQPFGSHPRPQPLAIPDAAHHLDVDGTGDSPQGGHRQSGDLPPLQSVQGWDAPGFIACTPMRPRQRTDPGNGVWSIDSLTGPHKLPRIMVRQRSGPHSGRGVVGQQSIEEGAEEEEGAASGVEDQSHAGALFGEVSGPPPPPSVQSRSASALENLKRCIKDRQAAAGSPCARRSQASYDGRASLSGFSAGVETPQTPTYSTAAASPFALPAIARAGSELASVLVPQFDSTSPRVGGNRRSSSGTDSGSFATSRASAARVSVAGSAAGDKEEVAFENLAPLRDPDHALRAALAAMQAANAADRKELDWQAQNDALNDCRRLVKHHPAAVCPALAELVAATLPAIDALRSFTAKIALVLYQELFGLLGRAVEPHVGGIVPMLLKRAAEVSNAGRENFLVVEARAALVEMCYNVSGARCVPALLSCSNHKAPNVRMCVAQHLDLIVELAGSGIGCWPSPTANWPLLERLFKAAVAFLSEGALETRTYGKRIVWGLKQLLTPAEVSSLVSHHSPSPAAQRKVQDVVDALTEQPPLPHTKAMSAAAAAQRGSGPRMGAGVGGAESRRAGSPPALLYLPVAPSPMPGPRSSFAGRSSISGSLLTPYQQFESAPMALIHRQSGSGGSGGSLSGARVSASGSNAATFYSGPCAFASSSSSSSAVAAAAASVAATAATPVAPAAKPLDAASLAKVLQALCSKDFRDRVEALKQMEVVLPEAAAASDSVLVQLLDALTVRLGDGNSKVILQALTTLSQLAQTLRERLALGLGTLVPALAANLGSGNDKVRAAAAQATAQLVECMHPATLLQPVCHSVASNAVRSKAALAEALESIIAALAPAKPQLVIKYALPAAACLFNDTKGGADTKAALSRLLSALVKHLGSQLMEQPGMMSTALQQRVAEMLGVAQRF